MEKIVGREWVVRITRSEVKIGEHLYPESWEDIPCASKEAAEHAVLDECVGLDSVGRPQNDPSKPVQRRRVSKIEAIEISTYEDVGKSHVFLEEGRFVNG